MRWLLLLLIVPLLTGCWDRIEMNDISFFMASALDAAPDGKLKVSIQVPIPAGAGSSQGGQVSATGMLGKTYYVVSSIGTNIYDAERQIQEKNARHFFKGHRRVVFIGEALAKKGIQGVLDYYARDPGSRLRTYLIVAKGAEGAELLQNDHPVERIPSEEVRELERSGVGTAVTFRDFLMMQTRQGIVPVTGAIELVPPIGDSNSQTSSPFKMFRLSSTAIFKNYRLMGYLNDIETRSLRWIKGELKEMYYGEKLPGVKGDVGVVMNKMSSRTKIAMNGGKAIVHIELSGVGVINESNSDLDLSRQGNVAVIEKGLGEIISAETLRTVKKTQTQWKTDVFGIGLQLHKYHYQTWKKIAPKWDAIYANADVTVTAKISLRRAGIITESFEKQGAAAE